MTGATGTRTPAAASPARVAVAIVLAAVVASAGNVVVALLVGVIQGRHLNPSGYLLYTVLGVLAGVVGWTVVRAFVPRPAAVLRVLVPAVVLISFVPDLQLFATDMSPVMIVGLMVMHVVVAVPTVLALRRVLPVS
ncbi:DUF6069 family protein [Pseudonocardia sp. HH130630-07]|uniref:DUF6069 family protein n=1 Tax=Pseudonocardia sp. HH130630-07 TaxID=1690815 RepID=UPI000815264D|nr:DUF6069 family protein [Pseudonocardia sp. HH130630-07]ANY08626.1 hypothetical protein AFB00_22800 [Pseudonocardia sp. HH130630-07]